MKVFDRNLEILLLNHDLVMIPGLGGFLANYKQAEFDNENEENLMMPPARIILFNKELTANDGLMIHAYMQYFDATYPQALKQLEVDVQDIKDELNEKGFVIFDNIGTLHLNLDGIMSFEQMHSSLVTPSLFALPANSFTSLATLENRQEIQAAINQISELPVANNRKEGNQRKIWKDIAISSAAAVALFFLFAFPYMNNRKQDEKIVAGAIENKETVVSSQNESDNEIFVNKEDNQGKSEDKVVNQPPTQIILLQPQTTQSNTLVISQNDLDNAEAVNAQDGDYTIVVTVPANKKCAMSVIDKLNKDNIPGAYYHSGHDGNFIYYSSFNTADDAKRTIDALKQVNKRFKKAWVKKIK